MESNYFTILQWFLPYIDMNQPWVYMCSPSWTPLPPPSPSHPSGSSQCTSPEHPVSCIEPGLVIYFTYGNIHVSVLFSQIIPPFPSPTESKSLFFISVSLENSIAEEPGGLQFMGSQRVRRNWAHTQCSMFFFKLSCFFCCCQVWCVKQSTQSQCTGTTQKDGLGCEVGGGLGMGDTCTPVDDSCQCT